MFAAGGAAAFTTALPIIVVVLGLLWFAIAAEVDATALAQCCDEEVLEAVG
jgi:hypothetical protein